MHDKWFPGNFNLPAAGWTLAIKFLELTQVLITPGTTLELTSNKTPGPGTPLKLPLTEVLLTFSQILLMGICSECE